MECTSSCERKPAPSVLPFHRKLCRHIPDFLGDGGDFRLRAVLAVDVRFVNTQHCTHEVYMVPSRKSPVFVQPAAVRPDASLPPRDHPAALL
jgi:hypothetical protein